MSFDRIQICKQPLYFLTFSRNSKGVSNITLRLHITIQFINSILHGATYRSVIYLGIRFCNYFVYYILLIPLCLNSDQDVIEQYFQRISCTKQKDFSYRLMLFRFRLPS